MNFSAILRVLAAALLLVCLGAGQAVAQSGGDVDPQAVERAQQAFDRGAAYYFEGEYSRALVEFRRANEAMAHPVFLFNMALCHRELGRVDRTMQAAEEARELFREFHERGEQVPFDLWARNDALIVSIETVDRAQAMAEALEAAEPADGQPVADISDVDSVDDSGAFGVLGWAGVGALAVGAGALGGAVVIDRQVASGIEELQGISDTNEFNTRRDSLQGQQTSGQVLLFSGIGLATVGTTLVILDLVSGNGDSNDGGLAVSPSFHRPGLDILVRW